MTWLHGAGALSLLLLGLRAVLPMWLSNVVSDQVEKATGHPLAIADLDLSLLRGFARLEGVRFAGETPTTPALSAASLHTNLEWVDLLWGDVHLREVGLVDPRIELVRGPGGEFVALFNTPRESEEEEVVREESAGGWPLSIDRVVATNIGLRVRERGEPGAADLATFGLRLLEIGDLHLVDGGLALGRIDVVAPVLAFEPAVWVAAQTASAESVSPPTATPGEEPPAIAVNQLAIRGAEFHLGTGDPLKLRLSLEVSGLSFAPGHRAPIQMALEIEGGRVEAMGTLGLSPPAYHGDLRWSSLDLERVSRAFGDMLPVVVERGGTDGALEIGFESRGMATLRGEVSLDAFEVKDRGNAFSAVVANLDVEAREIRVPMGGQDRAPQIELARVALGAPALSLRRAEANPPSKVSQSGQTGASAAENALSLPLGVIVESLVIREGRFAWADPAFQGQEELVLEAIHADATGLRWPHRGGGVDSLKIDARFASGGEVSLRGRSQNQQGSSVLEVSGLDLRMLRGYAKQAGYELRDGSLDLESEARFGAERIDLENHVVLGDLAVDSEGGSFDAAVGVPLDVALALLRDPTGKIGLRIPMTMERGETDLHLAAIFRSALRQALVGALTTPLKAVGFLIPGEASQQANFFQGESGDSARRVTLHFAEGSVDLEMDVHTRLENLAAFLRERPGVHLRVEGRYAENEARVPELPPVAAERPRTLLERAAGALRIGRERPAESSEGSGTPELGASALRELAEGRALRVVETLTQEFTVPSAQVRRRGAVAGGAEVVLELAFP